MFFSTFSSKLKFSKKNQSGPEILQEYLAILVAGQLGDEKQELPAHKRVNTKNMGWSVESCS